MWGLLSLDTGTLRLYALPVNRENAHNRGRGVRAGVEEFEPRSRNGAGDMRNHGKFSLKRAYFKVAGFLFVIFLLGLAGATGALPVVAWALFPLALLIGISVTGVIFVTPFLPFVALGKLVYKKAQAPRAINGGLTRGLLVSAGALGALVGFVCNCNCDQLSAVREQTSALIQEIRFNAWNNRSLTQDEANTLLMKVVRSELEVQRLVFESAVLEGANGAANGMAVGIGLILMLQTHRRSRSLTATPSENAEKLVS